jgi:hypothetical protein
MNQELSIFMKVFIYSIPILVIIMGYFLNRWRERISKLRDLKFNSYTDFISIVPYISIPEPNIDLHIKIAGAHNRLQLVGSKNVILQSYNLIRSIRSENKFSQTSLKINKKLFYTMRKDLHYFDRFRFNKFNFKPILGNVIENNISGVKIKFKIGDVFKSDKFSAYIIWLWIAYNELFRIFHQYQETKASIRNKSNRKTILGDGLIMYYFRLHCMHLLDLLERIKRWSNNKEFEDLLSKIPDSKKKILSEESEYRGMKLTKIKEDILRPIRNSIGHLIEIDDLFKIIKNYCEFDQYIIIGNTWGNTDFRIADEINATHINSIIEKSFIKEGCNDTQSEKTKSEAAEIVLSMTYDILNLTHSIVEEFYKSYMKDKSTTEDITSS